MKAFESKLLKTIEIKQSYAWECRGSKRPTDIDSPCSA